MATQTATRAASTFPVAGGVGNAQSMKVAYGTITLNTTPPATEVLELCRVPKGAVIVGGKFFGDRIDAGTSPALDIDIGWAGSTDALGNFGVLQSSATTGLKPEVSYLYELNGTLKAGPRTTTAETVIQATVVASATTFATGTIGVMVNYFVP